MNEYRPMLIANRPFDLSEHDYLRAIYADESQETVYMKAAQMGISEYLISWILYMAAERDATGIYVMPTDKHISEFSAARLGPAIEPNVSPRLAALITNAAGTKGKRGSDRVTLKRVGNRFVYFRGGQIHETAGSRKQNAAQLKSIDGDAVVLDELDELDPRVLPLARARLEHSNIARLRMGSTPSYPDMGVHLAYQGTDQCEWFVPCPACGERQAFNLENLVIEWDALQRPVAWYGQDQAAPYLACRKCFARMDRAAPGEWIPAYPDRPVRGYHLTGFISVRKSLQGFIDGLLSTDDTKRKETYNQGIGIAYEPAESEKLTEAVLNRCVRPYALGVVPEAVTFAGIDVGRVLNMVIRSREPNGDYALRYAGQIDSFDEAARLLALHGCKTVVIDALPETRSARALQRKFPRLKVWVAYFGDQAKGAKTESPATWNGRELEVDIDRTRAMDLTLAAFVNAALHDESGQPLPGFTLPANGRAIRDYYSQVMAPLRIVAKNAKGIEVASYVNSVPDHYAFAELYCMVATTCPYAGWARGTG